MCNGGPCKTEEDRLNVIRELAGSLNLDGFTTDQEKLMDVWAATHFHPTKSARILFPGRPKGYVRATRDIGHYACNKAVAMRCRKEGNIQTAQNYERVCELTYKSLPQFARW